MDLLKAHRHCYGQHTGPPTTSQCLTIYENY